LGCAGGVKANAGSAVNMTVEYDIFLDDVKIGVTKLEKADAPMGVVFGEIIFYDNKFCYDFLREYCVINNIIFSEHVEDKIINTDDIPALCVKDNDFNLIKGLACSILGMDNEGFEINIIGIEYPLYETLFPHHVSHYNNLFR
jgi:hypothetical protein